MSFSTYPTIDLNETRVAYLNYSSPSKLLNPGPDLKCFLFYPFRKGLTFHGLTLNRHFNPGQIEYRTHAAIEPYVLV